MKLNPILKYVQVCTHKRGTAVYFRRDGYRIRLPSLTSPNFQEAYDRALATQIIPHVRDMPPTDREKTIHKIKLHLSQGMYNARTRAKRKQVPFNLNRDWLFQLADAQEYRCAITGIEFFADCKFSKGRAMPYAPSIDRIEPKLGYVQGNVRLTVFAANAMLMDWGEEVFSQVARSYRYWVAKKARPIGSPGAKVGQQT